ncbi:hypothetical protein [Haliea sp. E1-2-M8]|uniref:hypothetical protein n=1 Tax=Haliea sp. E1-2-M8 TaxID=3064706 RepID=UPI00272CB818|nr:hypothetical protein [Haliea sp. E1-2-M8]
MMNAYIRPSQILLAVAVLAATALPALAQQTACPPDCAIEVVVPEDLSLPPASQPKTLVADAGAEIMINTNARVRIQFEGQSPFVNRNGIPVMNFVVNRGNRPMRVRTDGEACSDQNPCKYMIHDLPPLSG